MSESGHGHSTAAWTGVTVLMVAAVVLGLGVLLNLPWALWVGSALAVVGALAWYGLHAAGYGEEWESKH